MTRTELSDLAAWAEARLPRVTDDAFAAIVDRIPLYGGEQPVPTDDLRRSLEYNLRFLLTAVGDPQTPPDLAVPQETGRRRAHQGAPLPEVLEAYRISFATLWDTMVEHGRRGHPQVPPDALLSAASVIWQRTDEHARALTDAYRTATAELLVAQQRRRGALVDALLTGTPSPDAGPWEAAALLGLHPDGQLVVVVADTPGTVEESLPGIEGRLATLGIVSGWRLTPAQQLGVVSLQAGESDTLLGLLREIARSRTGVSPPYQSLADTPRALHLAQAALAGVAPGLTEVQMFSPSPLAALMVCEPGEGRRLAEQVLGGVLGLPAEDRTMLLDTLNAYLDHSGSAEHAANVLYCHPNTVRYRLRRLQELTGRSLSDPHGITELASAACALRHISATAPWRDRQPGPANGRLHPGAPRPASARGTGARQSPRAT